MRNISRFTLLFMVLGILFPKLSPAATYTWNGNGPNSNWNASSFGVQTNWGIATLPLSSASTDIVLGDVGGNSVQNMNNPFILNDLKFTGQSFTLSGSPLRFVADGSAGPTIVQASSNTQFLNLDISLGANLSIRSTDAPLVFNGHIGENASGRKLTIGSANPLGEVIFNGSNSSSGRTTLTGGTLAVNAGAILSSRTGDLTLNTNDGVGTTLELHSDQTVASLNGGSTGAGAAQIKLSQAARLTLEQAIYSTYSGQFSGNGYLEKSGPGNLMLSGASGSLAGLKVTGNGSSATLAGGNLSYTSTTSDGNAAVIVSELAQLTLQSGVNLSTPGGTAIVEGPATEDNLTTIALTGNGTKWSAAGGQLLVGNSAGTYGRFRLLDRSSMSAGVVSIGVNGWGSIDASDGATFTSDYGRLGHHTGATGGMAIDGSGSKWTVNQQLSIGGSETDGAGGQGTLKITSGANVQVNGTTTIYTPTSTVTIDGGTLTTGLLAGPATGGSVTLVSNPVSGTALVINAAAGSATYSGAISGAGGITKKGGSTQTLTSYGSYTGASAVNGGILRFKDNFLQPGSSGVSANAGGTIEYDGATVVGAMLSGAGLHWVDAGGATFDAVTIAAGATLTAANATSFNNVSNFGTINNSAGKTLTWDLGGIKEGGQVFVSGTANISNFVSDGLMQINHGATLNNSAAKLVLNPGSTTTVATDATLNLQGNTTIELSGGTLVDHGTIRGTANIYGGGAVIGTGKFDRLNLSDQARIAPGSDSTATVFSPGSLAGNSITFKPDSALEVQVGGTKSGLQFDQVTVTGQAGLAGTLAISNAPGFAAGKLSHYQVMLFASRTGTFTSYTGTDAGNGLLYAPVYASKDLTLTATIPGDANVDGKVDFADLVTVAQNYGAAVSTSTDNWWQHGDFTYDGKVDFNDLVTIAQHYGGASAAAADLPPSFAADWGMAVEHSSVPEPGALMLVLLALGVFVQRGRVR